ncbi:MAG: methylase RsmC, partial [Microbacterium sp.]|nr:methylase RsmC [Microbacterium sp.]
MPALVYPAIATPGMVLRQQVLELGQFDLRLSLATLRMLAEDVEDDRGAVDDLDLHDVLEGAPLAGRELGVGDDRVGTGGRDDAAQLLGLPSSDVRRGIRVRAPLQHPVEHDRAGRLGESRELAQGVLRILLGTLGVHTDEHDVLQPQLAVLDLGDVLELGGESGDATERRALLTIPLVAVRVRIRHGRRVLQRLRRSEIAAHASAGIRAREHPVDRIRLWVVGRFGGVAHVFLSRAPQRPLTLASRVRGWNRYALCMGSDHYFTASPASPENLRTIRVTLAGRDTEVVTAGGVFSPDRLDAGTAVLLANTPPPPPGGHFLDLGSGWGPISLSLALASPHATIWAVDVNQRALDLVRRNAELLGLSNINAVEPDGVPDDVMFRTIRSNPPIRVGKNELHDMLERWIPSPAGTASTARRRPAASACSRCVGTARRRATPTASRSPDLSRCRGASRPSPVAGCRGWTAAQTSVTSPWKTSVAGPERSTCPSRIRTPSVPPGTS